MNHETGVNAFAFCDTNTVYQWSFYHDTAISFNILEIFFNLFKLEMDIENFRLLLQDNTKFK